MKSYAEFSSTLEADVKKAAEEMYQSIYSPYAGDKELLCSTQSNTNDERFVKVVKTIKEATYGWGQNN